MNRLVQSVKGLDLAAIDEIFQKDPKWTGWSERDGKNALHYLCGVVVGDDEQKAEISLKILKLLLKGGLDINSVHLIPEKGCGDFPATPLWYAYTRGRNRMLYTYLLKNGASPDHCMFAIAWYDDPDEAALFKKYGAKITGADGKDTPFLAAFNWKKLKMARWFLENGADVNIADEKGNTALFYAVKMKGKYETADIELLLRYGADIERVNNEGVSPRVLAKTNGQRKILALFAARNA